MGCTTQGSQQGQEFHLEFSTRITELELKVAQLGQLEGYLTTTVLEIIHTTTLHNPQKSIQLHPLCHFSHSRTLPPLQPQHYHRAPLPQSLPPHQVPLLPLQLLLRLSAQAHAAPSQAQHHPSPLVPVSPSSVASTSEAGSSSKNG